MPEALTWPYLLLASPTHILPLTLGASVMAGLDLVVLIMTAEYPSTKSSGDFEEDLLLTGPGGYTACRDHTARSW